jgi:hypothetical protein
MPREQVRGVLAHELAHIRNRDVLVTTIAAMIGAAIAAIANFLQFQWLFGGDDDDSPLGAIGSIVAILVAPVAAMMLQFAISRQREFLADATAAELLGEGRPLAEALGTLQRGVEALPMPVNPADGLALHREPLSGGGVASLFSTHPPIPVRIARLRRWTPRAASTDGEDPGHGRRIGAHGRDAGGAVRPDRPALSWSEADLPERERTKHVHRLHPYLGKFVPQLVEALLERYVVPGVMSSTRSPAPGRRSSSRSSRAATRPAQDVGRVQLPADARQDEAAQPRRGATRSALGARPDGGIRGRRPGARRSDVVRASLVRAARRGGAAPFSGRSSTRSPRRTSCA